MRQIVTDEVLEEAADGGTAAVTCDGRVGPVGLDVIEEVTDRLGVEVAQFERGDAPTRALRNELEQQLQSVPVGADRMYAGAALTRQILAEERFDEGEQRSRGSVAHCGRRERRRCSSKRPLASSSNWGVALR